MALGGTFDLFHNGHKEFILKAFSCAEFVTIGIVSDEMARKRGKNTLENFALRKSRIKYFLNEKRIQKRVKIVQLNNIFGTTLKDKTIDSILLTEGTAKGAKKINTARTKMGLKPLSILKMLYVKGTDNKVISSSRIRNGEIDVQGYNYYDQLNTKKVFHLPDSLRKQLSLSLGEIIATPSRIRVIINAVNTEQTITVGDKTAEIFLSLGKKPFLSIIDFKIQRVTRYKNLKDIGFSGREDLVEVINSPGTINKQLCKELHKFFRIKRTGQVIRVIGEEDLAVIPCVLLAPLGFQIYYGLRDRGLVRVEVNLEMKKLMSDMIKRFD